jgi:hypothetical protein
MTSVRYSSGPVDGVMVCWCAVPAPAVRSAGLLKRMRETAAQPESPRRVALVFELMMVRLSVVTNVTGAALFNAKPPRRGHGHFDVVA